MGAERTSIGVLLVATVRSASDEKPWRSLAKNAGGGVLGATVCSIDEESEVKGPNLGALTKMWCRTACYRGILARRGTVFEYDVVIDRG